MKSTLTEKISLLIIFLNSSIGLIEILTGGLFKSSYIKIIFIFIAYIYLLIMLLNKRSNVRIIGYGIERTINIFVLFMIIDYILLFRLNNKYSNIEIVANFFVYLFYWVFISIIFSRKQYISKQHKERFHNKIRLYFYICAILSYSYALIYMIKNGIRNFIFYNTFFRVSSYFTSGYAFGVFINIVISISFARILFYKGKNKKIDYLMYLISLIFLYVTFTRNVYLMAMLIILVLITIKFSEKNKLFFRINKIIPYIFFGIALCLIIFNFSTSISRFVNNNMYNMTSLNIRMNTWVNIIDKYFKSNNIINILFGSGALQTPTSGLVIDCSFLGIYIYQGLLMLVIFILMYCKIWKWFCLNINKMNYYEKSYVSVFSVFLISSLFNNYMYGNYYFVLGLFIVVKLILNTRSEELKNIT